MKNIILSVLFICLYSSNALGQNGLAKMSDADIQRIAEPILADIVNGSNTMDWALFSKHMTKQNATEEARANVEKQWKENKYLTSLSESPVFLGVIRKRDNVLVVWKQKSTAVEDEFLEKLYLQNINGEIKQVGIWLE